MRTPSSSENTPMTRCTTSSRTCRHCADALRLASAVMMTVIVCGAQGLEDVVHLVIGVFSELLGVRIERIVDGEFHPVRGPRPVPARRIGQRDRELVAIGELSGDGLT